MKRDVSLCEVIAVIISSELENTIMNPTHHADGAVVPVALVLNPGPGDPQHRTGL